MCTSPRGSFRLLTTFQSWTDTTALSGKPIKRLFCPTCGSALVSCPDSAPEVVFIKAGTLDQIDEVVPKVEVVSRTAQIFPAAD